MFTMIRLCCFTFACFLFMLSAARAQPSWANAQYFGGNFTSFAPSNFSASFEILMSPDQSAAFALSIGESTLVGNGTFNCSMGVLAANSNATKWDWLGAYAHPVSSKCGLDFSPQGNMEFFVNDTNSIVWTSNTSGKGVVAVGITNSAQLLFLDGKNKTVWSSGGALTACPSTVCVHA